MIIWIQQLAIVALLTDQVLDFDPATAFCLKLSVMSPIEAPPELVGIIRNCGMRPNLVEHSHEDHENIKNWSLVETKDGFRYVLLMVPKLPAWEPAKTVYNITVYSFLAVP